MKPPRQLRAAWLHIGLPKSGTSTVQSALWHSRATLRTAGYVIPAPSQRAVFQAVLQLRGMLVPGRDAPAAFESLDRLVAAAQRRPRRHVLLSQESFAAATAEQAVRLVGLLEPREVHIVITARDLARQIPSAWQQRIRQRHRFTLEEFVDAVMARAPMADDFWRNQDLPAVVQTWAAAVPVERIHLVTVPPTGSDPRLLLDRFSTTIRLPAGVLSAPRDRANPTLGALQAELLRRVNVALGSRLPHPRLDYGPVGKAYLANTILAAQRAPGPQLPSHALAWCRAEAETTVATLRSMPVQVTGDLADLIPAATPAVDGGTTPDGGALDGGTPPDDAALLDVAVQALVDVLLHRHDELLARQADARPSPLRQEPHERVDDALTPTTVDRGPPPR